MREVGKGSWKDREAGKFFPSSFQVLWFTCVIVKLERSFQLLDLSNYPFQLHVCRPCPYGLHDMVHTIWSLKNNFRCNQTDCNWQFWISAAFVLELIGLETVCFVNFILYHVTCPRIRN